MFLKKSVSPLIATILLVVVSVILVTVVLTWGKDFVGKSLEETTSFYQESDLTGFITSQGNINNFITIANNHSKKSISVIGYRIITSTDHQYFHLLNNDYYLEEKITISPKKSSTIMVYCLPETSFSLDLLLEDNSFVRVNVNVRDFSSNLCSIYDGLILKPTGFIDDSWLKTGSVEIITNNTINNLEQITGVAYKNDFWTNAEIGKTYYLYFKFSHSNGNKIKMRTSSLNVLFNGNTSIDLNPNIMYKIEITNVMSSNIVLDFLSKKGTFIVHHFFLTEISN